MTSKIEELEARIAALEAAATATAASEIQRAATKMLALEVELQETADCLEADLKPAFTLLVRDVDHILRQQLGVGLDVPRILRAVA